MTDEELEQFKQFQKFHGDRNNDRDAIDTGDAARA